MELKCSLTVTSKQRTYYTFVKVQRTSVFIMKEKIKAFDELDCIIPMPHHGHPTGTLFTSRYRSVIQNNIAVVMLKGTSGH